MTRWFNLWLLGLLLAFGLPYYWLLVEAGTGAAKPQPLTIARLRALADEKPGAKPTDIRVETVGTQMVSGNLLAAGSGLRWLDLDILAFQIERPGAAPIVVDSGLPARFVDKLDVSHYDSQAQTRIETAIEQAAMRIELSRSLLHSGGIRAIALKQRNGGETHRLPPEPVDEPDAYAAAPGVVVVPTPDVSHGSRMIYVRTQDGREYLFAGEVAPVPQSWLETRAPARFMTDLYEPQDRAAITSWLLTVRQLTKAAPRLRVIEGRDSDPPNELRSGFTSASENPQHN